jgi:hypothetical protein
MTKKKSGTTNDMLDIMKTGVIWGATSSVVSSMTPTSGIGKNFGDVAQAGMGIMFIKDISKKIK